MMQSTAGLIAAIAWLNDTRLLPGFVHDRWDRCLRDTERMMLDQFERVPVKPITLSMLLGLAPIPRYWEAGARDDLYFTYGSGEPTRCFTIDAEGRLHPMEGRDS